MWTNWADDNEVKGRIGALLTLLAAFVFLHFAASSWSGCLLVSLRHSVDIVLGGGSAIGCQPRARIAADECTPHLRVPGKFLARFI